MRKTAKKDDAGAGGGMDIEVEDFDVAGEWMDLSGIIVAGAA